jgi:4-carboxymuconolactone decarboxylase
MDTRIDRMPPIPRERMDDRQKAAADELIAGPRKAVKGPFIPMMRSPEMLAHVQKLGAFLRFDSSLPPRVSEFASLIVARHMTQAFEWGVHTQFALKAGTSEGTIAALREGRRPPDMSAQEAQVHDFVTELLTNHGVSDGTYESCRAAFEERGVVELAGLVGYFSMVSMVLNVAHTPPEDSPGVEGLPNLPR